MMDMKCLCVGYHHIHDENFTVDRPDGSGDWLMLIVKTPAVFYIDGEEIHTKAGTYIIFPLHAPLKYSADGGEYIDDWLHFFPDEEDMRLFSELDIPLNTPVHIGDVTAASAIMRNICFEFYSAHQNRSEIVTLYLRMMLYKFNEQARFHYSICTVCCGYASRYSAGPSRSGMPIFSQMSSVSAAHVSSICISQPLARL